MIPTGDPLNLLVSSQDVYSPIFKIHQILAFDGMVWKENMEAKARRFSAYWARYCTGSFKNLNETERKNFNYDVHRIEELIWNETMDFVARLKEFVQIICPDLEILQQDWIRATSYVYYENTYGTLIKTFKNLINEIFGEYFKTDKPGALKFESVGKLIFPRALNVYLKRIILHSGKRKTSHMVKIYSLFQGLKKGLLPIRPDAVDDSLIEHKRLLTLDIPISGELKWFIKDIFCREFQDLVVEPKKTFLGRTEGHRNISRKRKTFSNHSTLYETRSNGGQIGLAYRLRDLTKDQFLRGRIRLPEPEQFHGFLEIRQTVTSKVTGVILQTDSWLEEIHGDFIDELECYYLLTEARAHGLLSTNISTPCVILEPLKGRIITKPSDGEYLDFGDIQDWLWKKIQKHREFELVSRPVSVEDIYYVAGSWKYGYGFNSGDFSGATDNLAGRISKILLRLVLSKCSQDFVDNAVQSFCHSKLDYRNNPMNPGDSPWLEFYNHFGCTEQGLVEQCNGQLMGHILSFPILCLANYIIFKYTYFKMDREAPRVLINGDDILFCCTKEEYKEWCHYTREVGLIPSLGKNLFQTDIAQINSVLFDVRFSDQLGVGNEFIRDIRPVPFVNFGVLTGRGKGKENPFDRKSILESQRELDEVQPEVESLHSVMRLWNYTDDWIERDSLKSVFYKHRPKTRALLKELENWNEKVVAILFKKSGFSDRFPGNSSAVFRSQGGETSFQPHSAVRQFQKYPLMFDERTVEIVERTRRS